MHACMIFVNYRVFDTSNTIGIHIYLMKKYDLK